MIQLYISFIRHAVPATLRWPRDPFAPWATEVLRRYFGTDEIAYTLTTPPPTSLMRTFKSLSQAAGEAVDARVFGGMHFRTAAYVV